MVKPLCLLLWKSTERNTHVHTRTHTQTKNVLALTVDEGCRGPGINRITKQKTKASEGKEKKKTIRTQQLRTDSSIGEHNCA